MDASVEIMPACRNADSLERKVSTLETEGSTNMAGAITMATERLHGKAGERIIFLVTDGAPDDRQVTLVAAQAARSGGIDIMTLGTESADHGFLRQLASRQNLARNVTTTQMRLGIKETAKFLLKD